jgi:uncharacterized protein
MASDTVFLDTSGFVAYLDADDEHHARAASAWSEMIDNNDQFATTDYVRLESWALIQRKLGMEAVKTFHSILLPLCQVEVVGQDGFERAVGLWMLAKQRRLSLVDVASFDCMQRLDLRRAFAFDGHFKRQGFQVP